MVGIDIGSNSVKVVELSLAGGNCRLENIGEALFPYDAITRKSISRDDVVSAVISNLVSGLGVRKKKAVMGLSGEAVAFKVVNVPENFLGKDIKKLVPDIVSSALSINISDVNYSYTTLVPSDEVSGQPSVLVAAVSKKIVQEYKNSIAAAGLRAPVIDIDAMALSNAYTFFHGDNAERVALVNIGASGTNLSVLDDKVPCVLRDIPLGGQWITSHLMEKFKITYEEAERIKCSVRSYSIYDEIEGVFKEFIARVAGEIRTVFEEIGGVIERIVLCGGSSRIAAIRDQVAADAGIPVEIWNPFQNIEIADSRFDPKYVEHLAPKMAVAVGLALRGL
ncbi:MAG: type IV pilus assembly protein PilM [Candidatus Dadabacteria bacterium]|nr:type IV pilus assembly protein PilM [Candidatus Dadabacteria bacterium]